MFGFSAFNKKPRQFNYQPRFYDPEKEARDQRRRELGLDKDDPKPANYTPGMYVSQSRRRRMDPSTETSHQAKRVGIRAIIVLFILIALGYAIFNSTGLVKFVMLFNK